MEGNSGKFSFKSAKKRAIRRRADSDEEEAEEEFNKEEYEKTLELQKLRKRAAGTNVITLASGKKVTKVEEALSDDPFKLNTGGLVDMKTMKGYKQVENPYDVGTQFSKETHIRDEDDEMRKFIETEMDKMKGTKGDEGEEEDHGPSYLSPEDAALLSLPEHLRKSTFKKDQQMLSAQMLSGIPEVDLGIEAKIQNIERTEKAKRKLLEDAQKNVGKQPQSSNDYVQHDRFRLDFPRVMGRSVKETSPGGGVPGASQLQSMEGLNSEQILQGKASDEAVLKRYKENAMKNNMKKKKIK